MKIKVRQSKIRTVRPGDATWHIVDGVTMTPRAGFEISEGCPDSYKKIILSCLDCGWLKPVAHLTDQEQMWEILSSN